MFTKATKRGPEEKENWINVQVLHTNLIALKLVSLNAKLNCLCQSVSPIDGRNPFVDVKLCSVIVNNKIVCKVLQIHLFLHFLIITFCRKFS